jgi:hypothetical protein
MACDLEPDFVASKGTFVASGGAWSPVRSKTETHVTKGRQPMEQILLFDADAEHARQIVAALGSISCRATICVDIQSAVSLLERQLFDVVLVVTVPRLDWDISVEFVRHSVLRLAEPPRIICLLRGPYCGPNARVYAARKGFRVVYEQ